MNPIFYEYYMNQRVQELEQEAGKISRNAALRRSEKKRKHRITLIAIAFSKRFHKLQF